MSWKQIAELSRLALDHSAAPPLTSRFNIAPTQDAPIVRRSSEGLEGAMARWDLVPRWWTKPLEGKRYATFNARVEEVANKPMFKDSVRHRRCLVPASYFIEWRTEEGGKQPYRIGRADEGLMMLAGIWDSWSGTRKGEAVAFDSFSIHHHCPKTVSRRASERTGPICLLQSAAATMNVRGTSTHQGGSADGGAAVQIAEPAARQLAPDHPRPLPPAELLPSGDVGRPAGHAAGV